MNWGDLWDYPFLAGIWGTVSAWVSALLTSGAFTIAALVYWRDSNLSRSAQAKLILPRMVTEPIGEDVRIVLENYSSNSIFNPEIQLRRINLWEAVRMDSSEEFLLSPDPSKSKVREIVDRTSKGGFTDAPALRSHRSDKERLTSSDHCEFHISRTRYQRVFLTFVDARGRGWEVGDLASQRPSLRKLKRPSTGRKRLSRTVIRVRHPWRAWKELRMRFKVGWRAFWVQLLILFTEAVAERLDDEDFKQRMRDVVTRGVQRGLSEGLSELKKRRQNDETGINEAGGDATPSGAATPQSPEQP